VFGAACHHGYRGPAGKTNNPASVMATAATNATTLTPFLPPPHKHTVPYHTPGRSNKPRATQCRRIKTFLGEIIIPDSFFPPPPFRPATGTKGFIIIVRTFPNFDYRKTYAFLRRLVFPLGTPVVSPIHLSRDTYHCRPPRILEHISVAC